MRTLIVILAAALALAFAEFELGAGSVQAASSYCQQRYNICLARCAPANQRCPKRCRSQYQSCITPAPNLGDLI
jgi:hypothetical protein